MHAIIYDPSGRYSDFYREVIREGCADADIFISGNRREIYGQGVTAPVDLLIAELQMTKRGKTDVGEMYFLERLRKLPMFRFVRLVVVADVTDEAHFAFYHLRSERYYEKPINRKIFREDITELVRYLASERENWLRAYIRQNTSPYLFFTVQRELRVVRSDRLIRFEKHEKEGYIVTQEERLRVDISSVRDNPFLYESGLFICCSRQDYVNRDYIQGVSNGELIIRDTGEKIRLTPKGKENVENLLSIVQMYMR